MVFRSIYVSMFLPSLMYPQPSCHSLSMPPTPCPLAVPMNNGVSECLAWPGVHSRGLKCTPGVHSLVSEHQRSLGLQANDVGARRGIHENRWHGSPPGEMPWRSELEGGSMPGVEKRRVPSFPPPPSPCMESGTPAMHQPLSAQ